jgi:tetratricopeptide (TPR) repeat protein
MMVAVEQHSFAKSDEYITLFHRYISRSIEALYTRLGPELQALSNETREQAWHLLDYGLKLTYGWEVVRKLLLALAPRMERDGFRHEWLPYLEGGVAFSQRVQDVSAEAELSLYIGRLYRLRAEYTKANSWFMASAELYQQLGDNEGRAKALNQLAYVARLQNQFALAKNYVDEALSLLDEQEVERANSHWVLASLAHAQFEWTEAEKHHRTALQIWQEAGDQQRAAWNLQNLGNTLRAAGRYAEAAEYIQQAIVLLGQLHDPVNQAIARMNRGVVHIYDKDPAQALALFHLAEPIFRQVGDQLHLAMVYTNMLIVQRDLGQLAASEDCGKKAIYYSGMLNDLKILANAKDELGLTYLAQGRKPEAIASFEAGIETIAQVPHDPFQKMVQSSLLTHLEEAKGSGNP